MNQHSVKEIPEHGRWGCYAASLASLVERHLGYSLESKMYAQMFFQAVQKGFILHNDLPTDGSQGEWYRCFVVDPVKFLNSMLERVGVKMRVYSVHHDTLPGPDFTLICYQTKWGYHFALGNAYGKEIVNPDPKLPVIKVHSYRIFKVI